VGEGYAVDTAADGGEGLEKALDHDYDAILLDAMLPVLDGWALLARLRKTKKTPVLMLTARDGSADRVRGLDGGADDYVVKPFDLPELLARLRALIRRGAAGTGTRLDFGEGRGRCRATLRVAPGGDGDAAAERVCSAGIPRAASRGGSHAHHALRPPLRRKRIDPCPTCSTCAYRICAGSSARTSS
jgi:DNA-binding response OmpR family regulator